MYKVYLLCVIKVYLFLIYINERSDYFYIKIYELKSQLIDVLVF